MKTTLTIILTFFTIYSFCNHTSLNDEELKLGYKYPGYIILNNNDTIHGYVKFVGRATNQKKCELYKNETDKKPMKVYKPKEAREYKIGHKLYKTINYSGGLLSKPLRFLRVMTEGRITIFTFYDEAPLPYKVPDSERETTMVYHKWNDPKFKNPVTNDKFALSFAKNMSKFVADYTVLSDKVKNKEKGYRMLNILDIIEEYNLWFQNNNQ